MKGKNIDKSKYANPDDDPRGDWFSADLTGLANREQRPNLHYDITNPITGLTYHPNPTRGWSCSRETMQRLIEENRILWPSKPDGRPRHKKYLSEITNENTGFSTMLNVGFTTEGTRILQDLFGSKLFSYPKPVSLIKMFIEQSTDKNDIILDFFSGSATTAQATMEQNAKDGRWRKFILVQITENTEDDKFLNICEIGKERIRRAGEKIKTEAGLTALNLDTGFRVLKLDDTNMTDVYYAPGEYTQDMLPMMENNIKPDRTDMDLLYACLLDWGLPLSMPHTHEKIDGFTVHTYNDGDLIACFDEHISEKAIREIAGRKPLRAVFRDSGFTSSPEKINVFEIFKLLAPNTNVRVI